MAGETRELVIVMTHGADHELSSVGFTVANGALTAGMKVYASSPAPPLTWYARDPLTPRMCSRWIR